MEGIKIILHNSNKERIYVKKIIVDFEFLKYLDFLHSLNKERINN